VKRSKFRRQLVAALATMLPADEEIVAAGRAWLADRRSGVPLLFTGRAFYLVAVTGRRLVVFDRPRRGRPVLEADLRFARRFEVMELQSVRRWALLLQLRIAIPDDDREIVVELRWRDRPVGDALASALGRAAPDAHAGAAGPEAPFSAAAPDATARLPTAAPTVAPTVDDARSAAPTDDGGDRAPARRHDARR